MKCETLIENHCIRCLAEFKELYIHMYVHDRQVERLSIIFNRCLEDVRLSYDVLSRVLNSCLEIPVP